MLPLRTIERPGVVLPAVLGREQRDAAEATERVRELSGERDRVGAGAAERADRDHARTNRRREQLAARLQLQRERPRNRHREARVALEQRVEHVGLELEQLTVADRLHGRRARRAGEKRELADRRSRAELAHHFRAVLLLDEHPEPAAAHEVEAIARVALADEHVARPDLQRPCVLEEGFERLRVGARQKRKLREQILRRDELTDAHTRPLVRETATGKASAVPGDEQARASERGLSA